MARMALWTKAFPERVKPKTIRVRYVKRISSRRRKVLAEDAKVLKQWKREHPHCEVCHLRRPKRRTRPTDHRHHVNGRIGARMLDPKGFKATCWDCHRHIHDNPKWAREHGLLNFNAMQITLWLIRETDKARLYSKVRPDRNPTEADQIWIPRSVVEHTSKVANEHTLTLPDWFIEREGL